jgi:magnesium chelatase family protein
LDEAAEFHRVVLDALRVPLESGEVVISRSGFTSRLPARFQLVLASNPCPCGMFVDSGDQCSCTPQVRRRYFARLSGPLLDRVDLRVFLAKPTMADFDPETEPESSAVVANRVLLARDVARKRYSGQPWLSNAQVPGPIMRKHFPISTEAMRLLRRTCGGLSARGIDRIFRLAWTIADVNHQGVPTALDVELALHMRDGAGLWR